MAEVKKIDLAANLDYAMTLQFMDRLEKNGKISSDERMRLKDEIETKEGKPRVIDSSERVQRELRRMKVVNNRDNVFDNKPVYTHFVRESRYVNWKNQMERNGYQRSNSNKGMWRKNKDMFKIEKDQSLEVNLAEQDLIEIEVNLAEQDLIEIEVNLAEQDLSLEEVETDPDPDQKVSWKRKWKEKKGIIRKGKS